jgi:hypothetical protein
MLGRVGLAKRSDEAAGRRRDKARSTSAAVAQRLDDGGLEAVRIEGDEAQRKAMAAWRRRLARDPQTDRG